MNRLTHVHVAGFKSIREADLDLRPLNVLIGANASGKSSFLSLFRLRNVATGEDLQAYVARSGGAKSLLYYGSKTTTQITIAFAYETEDALAALQMRLRWSPPDTLVLAAEEQQGEPPCASEARGDYRRLGDAVARVLARWGVYHFLDTSATAAIREQCYKDDNRDLRSDGGNLAACLHLLRETARPHYDRIVRMVRLAFPEFDDFDVEPLALNERNVMLNWREVGRDQLFGPHMLSDGTLRFMALAALLLQPDDRLPDLVLIDEPELGLHPYAISLLGGMLRSVSEKTQVIVATQSVALVDEFDPEDIVVTERRDGATTFERLDPEALAEWLEDYSVSELWEKNVIGGRP